MGLGPHIRAPKVDMVRYCLCKGASPTRADTLQDRGGTAAHQRRVAGRCSATFSNFEGPGATAMFVVALAGRGRPGRQTLTISGRPLDPQTLGKLAPSTVQADHGSAELSRSLKGLGRGRNTTKPVRNRLRFVPVCGHHPGHLWIGFVRLGSRFGPQIGDFL